MSFSPEFLDLLRARLSLADVVGKRVTFDRRKSNPRKRDFWACCPFHSEKTPSFHVNDAQGYFHCFGCGARGDAISFLEQAESLSFREAVERLAAEAGLQIPAADPRARERWERRRSLGEVLDAAQRFFARSLGAREGEGARRYLEGRRCGPELWQTFGLGYAPGRLSLHDHLKTEGYSVALMEEAGLVGQDAERGPYERFRERIMFPIRDGQDRLVGFGGRTLSRDPNTPKYLNSPETPLFDKGRLLFNYGPARRALREAGTLLVVEGYMDVIALHGAGFKHAVAPLGTALTAEQLQLIWKAAGEPILCFDGDSAGRRAAYRAADLALPLAGPGRSLRFALLPEGQDPDDLIRSRGAAAMSALLAEPLPLIALIFERELQVGPLDTPERRADLERRLVSAVRRIQDSAVRGHYERAVRERLRDLFGFQHHARPAGRFVPRPAPGRAGPPITSALRRNALVQESRREQARPKARLTAPLGAPALPEPAEVGHYLADIEAALIGLILDHPELLPHVAEAFGQLEPAQGKARGKLDKIFSKLIDLASAGERLDGDHLRDHLRRCGVGDAIEEIGARDVVRRMRSQWVGRALGDAEHAWRVLAERHVKVQRLRAEIEEAEAALGDEPGADTHWQRLKALMAERQILERGSFWPEDQGGSGAVADRDG